MQRFLTTAVAAAALLMLTGGWSGQAQAPSPAGATDAEVAAVQSVLAQRNGTVSALWRVQREQLATELSGSDSVIPADARRAFSRSYLATVLAPAPLAELERSFNGAFAGAMSAQERADPTSLSAERQTELTVAAEGAITNLLHDIHTAGLADACEESRARAHLCIAMSIMVRPSNPWRRVRPR